MQLAKEKKIVRFPPQKKQQQQKNNNQLLPSVPDLPIGLTG